LQSLVLKSKEGKKQRKCSSN